MRRLARLLRRLAVSRLDRQARGAMIIVLYLAAFAFWIWALIRIGRGSVLLAIVCFLLWPLALIPLIRNWGDPDSDIRLPFFAALLCSVLAAWLAYRSMDEILQQQAAYLSDQDIALIAEQDPDYALLLRAARQQIDQEQAAAAADQLPEQGAALVPDRSSAPPVAAVERTGETVNPNAAATTGFRPAAPLTQLFAADSDLDRLEAEVRQLAYRLGRIEFESARAELPLPGGFRYLPRRVVARVARLRGTELDPRALGWVVHQQVSLADPEGWYVEVLHIDAGHFSLGQPIDTFAHRAAALAGQLMADGSDRVIGGGRHAPTWSAAPGVLTWAVFGTTADLQSQAEVLAARPLRQGVLLFVMHGVEPEREELALRATRLLAELTEVAPEHQHTEFRRGRDRQAAQDLLSWVAGKPVAP